MDISNLAGLEKPLCKLVEVSAQAIGGACAPWQMNRLAKADQKIEESRLDSELRQTETRLKIKKANDEDERENANKIIATLNIAKEQGLSAYWSEKDRFSIACSPEDSIKFLELQSKTRLEQQEIRHQININNVVIGAAEQLKDIEDVPAEKPEDDWIARFFDDAQDISDKDLQQLWSRVLAGELEHPRTYSKRSLKILKDLSTQEAETFAKIGALALSSGSETCLIYPPGDHNWLEKNIGISLIDIQKLFEIGIILPNENLVFTFEEKNIVKTIFFNKIFKLYFSNEKDRGFKSISCFKFTSTGRELLNLVTPIENNSYINKLFEELNKRGMTCYKLGIDDPIPDPQYVTFSL